jgi:hypothetical protein
MPIKKRSNRVIEATPVENNGKLNIVAAEKKPLPDRSKIADTYGDDATPSQLRRLGNVALACGDDTPDLRLTVSDRVKLMRTPYDKNNAQEIRYRNRVRNRGTAITAMCITCQGGRKAVTECIDTQCPLWAFRFGSDPFYGKKK